MSNQRNIKTTSDIAALTPDEFERFIPDLILWHSTLGQIRCQLGCELQEAGFLWIDDGANELKFLRLIDSKSGAEMMVEFEHGAESIDEPINAAPTRLELCLNACDGIDTADLKAGSVSIIHKLHDEAAQRVLAQRDELLAAMRSFRDQCEMMGSANWRKWEELASPEEFERWVKSRATHMALQASAAIAKVEGGA